MNIAICDDCMIDVIRLEKLIKASKLCPKDMEITRFISGEEGMNGIDTAKKIRKCNSKAVLSFYSGYEVGAQNLKKLI